MSLRTRATAAIMAQRGYNGVIEPGMTHYVESYIGASGQPHAMKLQRQSHVIETGTELLSNHPFEASLLS